MKKELRPYQQDALNALRQRLKETTHPLLVNASVGAGKSLIIASLLQIIERANWRALCLTMNSTLIQQNAETYHEQGGNPGIYCSGLNAKDTQKNVIFASPNSVIQGIKKGSKIKDIQFNLIIIDESHNINPHDRKSMYLRILNHYGFMAQSEQYKFRVVGLTGTPYRGKGINIVGENQYFKEQVCDISSSWLINNGYLVPPVFQKTHVEGFDMKKIRVDNTGKFKHKDLQAAVDKDKRLTGFIIDEIVTIVERERNGCFIFASTVKHAKECMQYLPIEQSALISAETPHKDRKDILIKARAGEIKYLVNVATLLVGVDVPNFDTIAWLRPTESLVLYTQGIGRGLRLYPGKTDAWILDYAGNLERHGDIDDPLILEALKQKEKDDPEYCIPCYRCGTNNKVTARRCIGHNEKARCDYYFIFKSCDNCGSENDITARHCRACENELIDPNNKLKSIKEYTELKVLQAQYWVSKHTKTDTPIINARYTTNVTDVFECYFTSSEKAKNMFYGRFIKHHFHNGHEYYLMLTNYEVMDNLIHGGSLLTPHTLHCKQDKYNRYQIVSKDF